MKKCFYCDEEMEDGAIHCKHCGEALPGMSGAEPKEFTALLNHICNIIGQCIQEDITILLIGSYARGHAGFNEKRHPVRDVDLVIVSHKDCSINVAEIKNQLELSQNISNLIIDLHFYTLSSLKEVLPFWRFYDIRHHSRLIFGEDIRNKICNFESTDISPYDGLRMLAGEALNILRDGEINEHKLNFIYRSAEKIKNNEYGQGNISPSDKISIGEYSDFAINYYVGGYTHISKYHLQPTINYILKKKFNINAKKTFVVSFFSQLLWTFTWFLKTGNLKVLLDWRDPALRIYYSLFYYFSEGIDQKKKIALFKKVCFDGMTYSKENIVKLYDSYFLGNKWKFVRKSTWTINSKVTIQ